MPLRVYKPTTSARRRTSVDTFEDVTKKRPEKRLLMSKKDHAGRNSTGKITVRHRGGGVKRHIRLVDFLRNRYDMPAKVTAIEYDPNRSARLALLVFPDGVKNYMIAPQRLKVGDSVTSSQKKIKIELGNRMPIEHIPVGVNIYDVELTPGKGGQIARSAGTLVKIMAVDGPNAQLKLPSGEIRLVHRTCLATVGEVSNPDIMHIRIGRAGRKRHMGIRPSVRGKVMNPVDHPHGGGEGRNPIGLKHPKTPWGKPALGVKTRRKRSSDRMILSRRKHKRR